MWTRFSPRRAAIASFAFACVAAYAAPSVHGDDVAAPPDPFAGEWAVAASPDRQAFRDGQGPFDEAVLFHEGQFSAAVFAMFGFSPAAYTIDYSGGAAVFSVTLPSNDRGTLLWTGTQTPTGIGGDLAWTHADGSVDRYTFTGERPQ